MNVMIPFLISNLLISCTLALGALVAARVIKSKELSYGLWLLVIVKLVTPPIWHFNMPVVSSEPTPIKKESFDAKFGELSDSAILGEDLLISEIIEPQEFGYAPFIEEGTTDEIFGRPTKAVYELPLSTANNEIMDTMAWIPEIPIPNNKSDSVEKVATVPVKFVSWNLSMWDTLIVFWLIGSLVYVVLFIWRFLSFNRLVKRLSKSDGEIKDFVERCLHKYDIQKSLRVVILPINISPSVFWIFQKHILIIPQRYWHTLDEEEKEYAIMHELGHIQRGDCIRRFFELVITTLYWWNPIVWLAKKNLHSLEEQLCDDWVLRKLDGSSTKYATLVVKSMEFLSRERYQPLPKSACGFGNDSNRNLNMQKERITMILNQNGQNSKWRYLQIVCLALAAAIILPVGLLNQPAHGQETSDPESPAKDNPNDVLEALDEIIDEVAKDPSLLDPLPDIAAQEPELLPADSDDTTPSSDGDIPSSDESIFGEVDPLQPEEPVAPAASDDSIGGLFDNGTIARSGKKIVGDLVIENKDGARVILIQDQSNPGFQEELSPLNSRVRTSALGTRVVRPSSSQTSGEDMVFGIVNEKEQLEGVWKWTNQSNGSDYAILKITADGKLVIENNEMKPQMGTWTNKEEKVFLDIEGKMKMEGFIRKGFLHFVHQSGGRKVMFIFHKQRKAVISTRRSSFQPSSVALPVVSSSLSGNPTLPTPVVVSRNVRSFPRVSQIDAAVIEEPRIPALPLPPAVKSITTSPSGELKIVSRLRGDKFWLNKYEELGFKPIKKSDYTKMRNFFMFEYDANPQPGKRLWMRIDKDHWVEQYPNGITSKFFLFGRTAVKGQLGSVAVKISGNPKQTNNDNQGGQIVFIPDTNVKNPKFHYQKLSRGDKEWVHLADIIELGSDKPKSPENPFLLR